MAFSFTTESAITNTIAIKPCKIDTNKYLICEYDSGSATFSIIEFNGSAISETALTGTLSTYGQVWDICALSTTTFVIVYRGASTLMSVVACTLSGTTLTFGDPVTSTSGSVTPVWGSICTLSSSKFVTNAIHSNGTQVACGTVSTRTITLGTVDTTSEGDGTNCSIFKLDTDKFGMTYQNSSRYPTTRVGTVASTTTITFGDAKVLKSSNIGTSKTMNGCQLDTDKFLVAFAGGYNEAYVCTCAGTTTITAGDAVSLGSLADYIVDCTTLSTTEPVVTARHFASGYKSRINKGTLDGTTYTLGTWETINTTAYDYRCISINDKNVALVRAGYTRVAYIAASGPSNLKSYNTNLKANIKTINTNLIANVKSLDGNS